MRVTADATRFDKCVLQNFCHPALTQLLPSCSCKTFAILLLHNRFKPMVEWPAEEGALYTLVLSNLDINTRENRFDFVIFYSIKWRNIYWHFSDLEMNTRVLTINYASTQPLLLAGHCPSSGTGLWPTYLATRWTMAK